MDQQLSTSGSFQSHLSASNSLQRLRAAHPHDIPLKASPVTSTLNTSRGASHPGRISSVLSLFTLPVETQFLWIRSWSTLGLRWRILLVYSCISVLVLSANIFNTIRSLDRSSRSQVSLQTSPLELIANQQRLSRILPIYPLPKAFVPFFLAGSVKDPNVITACLWSREEDLDLLTQWASNWPGHISLLLTTTAHPTLGIEPLLSKLQAMKTLPWFTSLSLHLFHTSPNAQEFPNMYLNLARFFSATSRVVIFPGNLSVLPPLNVHSLLYERPSSQKPVILTAEHRTYFPFPALAPVVLPSNYTVWCTERFFFVNSRSTDWVECLRQFWLDAFGKIETIQIPGLENNDAITPVPTSMTNNIRQRMLSRYRSDTCDLAAKRLSTLKAFDEQDHQRNLRWLKRFCRR